MKSDEARPEPKTAEQLLVELRAHLEDLDRQEERLKLERGQTRAAIDAMTPRRKPGRPAART